MENTTAEQVASDRAIYRMRGCLGILSEKLRISSQLDLQEKLTLQMKAWNNAPATEVRAFFQDDGYFWIPRFFFQDAVTKQKLGKYDVKVEWSVGQALNLPFLVNLDPARGQVVAVDEVVHYLQTNSGGILVAPTACGKTILGYAVGHRLNTNIGVLVYNAHMVKNWFDTAKMVFGLSDDQIGIVQRERCDLGKPVTVMMIQSLLNSSYPPELFNQFGFIIGDECVVGDTLVTTNVGPVPIRDIPVSGATEVLSFDVSRGRWQFKRINRWVPRNSRAVMEIRAGSKTIRCTPEHLFFTDRGWLPARLLRPGFRVLSPAPVVVDQSFSTSTLVAVNEDSYQDTLEKYRGRCLLRRGVDGGVSWRLTPRSANVDAVREFDCQRDLRRRDDGVPFGRDSFPGTVAHIYGDYHLVESVLDSYTELSLAILVLLRVMENLLIRGSILITEKFRESGQNISHYAYMNSDLQLKLLGMVDLVRDRVLGAVVTIRALTSFMPLLVTQSELMQNGWTASQRRVGRGGTWTMDHYREEVSDLVRKDIHDLKLTALPDICPEWDSDRLWQNPKEDTGSSDSESRIRYYGSSGSEDSVHQEWNTNFLTITEIIDDPASGVEPVYDIEVEDNHNFVANEVLVHNCNHLGAPLWNEVIRLFPARYRLGLSADPNRDDGLDKLIGWHFGKIAHKVVMKAPKPDVVQLLLRRTYHIGCYTDPWKRTPSGDPMPNPLKYDKVLASDDDRNKILVAEIVKMRKAGRRILIFSRLTDHLDFLKKQFEESWSAVSRSQCLFDDESIDLSSTTTDPNNTVVTLLVGGLKKDKLDSAMKGDVIFTSYAFARDALNLPHIDTLLFATPPGKPLQPIGRLRDKGPPDRRPLLAIDVYEECPYAIRKAQKRADTYRHLGIKVSNVSRGMR